MRMTIFYCVCVCVCVRRHTEKEGDGDSGVLREHENGGGQRALRRREPEHRHSSRRREQQRRAERVDDRSSDVLSAKQRTHRSRLRHRTKLISANTRIEAHRQ